MKFAFAGDRDIAVKVLDFMLAEGVRPAVLMTTDPATASHAAELVERCALPPSRVFQGEAARSETAIAAIREEAIDLILGIHFPLLVPQALLDAPRRGFLNLHPAYLPWNRGWHTPSWAILDGTPIGATLHFMDAGLDSGDIVHQRRLEVSPADTAHTLYTRLKDLEFEVFREAWPSLVAGTYTRTAQDPAAGTAHRKRDLASVQQIDPSEPLLTKLRALTTSRIDEGAWFEHGGKRYRVQVKIEPEE